MEWYWFLLIYVVLLFVFVFVYVMVNVWDVLEGNTFGDVVAAIFAAILIAIVFVLFFPIAPFCLPILIYQNGGQKHKVTLFTLKGELTPENKTTLEQIGFKRADFNFFANVAKEHYLKRFEKTHIYVYDDGCCSVWGKITEEVKFYIIILKGLPQPEEIEEDPFE